MNALVVGLIAFLCAMAGAAAGMRLRGVLPEDHLSSDSRDVVKLITGLLATLTALVLGLLIASAKGSFDAVNNNLRHSAVTVILIDRTLAEYGPEAAKVRKALRDEYAARMEVLFPTGARQGTTLEKLRSSSPGAAVGRLIRELPAAGSEQQALRAHAEQLLADLSQSRWTGYEDATNSTPTAFLVVVVSWIAAMFASFGLFSPRNATALTALVIGAMAVATALFLIQEMVQPLDGIIAISSEPMRDALAVLGR